MSASPASAPRILFMDDNVRNIGGHYLELASLLADGARDLGYQPRLVTHESLLARQSEWSDDSRLANLAVEPRFQVRRMENWSLGVDGPSMTQRDCEGNPIGGTFLQRWSQSIRDVLCRPARRPSAMLDAWANGFAESIIYFDPIPDDQIVINTGGDFQILALAAAIDRLEQNEQIDALTIHVIFHFAVFDSEVTARGHAFGRQVNAAIASMNRHQIRLHATTHSLTNQLSEVGITATAIPYPTRIPSPWPESPSAASSCRLIGRQSCHLDERRDRRWDQASEQAPNKIVLAGMPRAEKGRDQIKSLLQSIETSQLRSGKCQWSMQLPSKRWERMVPQSMHDLYHQAVANPSDTGLEVLHGNLTSADYHHWLDSADVGLFLYDPDRYVARCSGVLLEMMIRGVPVIVPNRCWLADQVRSAGERNAIGWIYHSTDEIPSILSELEHRLADITVNCQQHAQDIASIHSGRNMIREMGIADLNSQSRRAVG